MDPAQNKTTKRRPWVRPLLIGLAIFGILAAAMGWTFFGSWMQMTNTPSPEAQRLLDTAVIEAGGGPAYIEIAADGTVVVHRDQVRTVAEDFGTLTVLAWSPGEDKLLRVDYPRWFVRLKTSTSVNLGTMIAMARRDWAQLDLSVNFADLTRRGPALLLDHRLANGARIVVWTSRKGN